MVGLIALPKNLDLRSSLAFAFDSAEALPADTYEINYGAPDRIEPFGLLLVTSAIRRFLQTHSDAAIRYRNVADDGYARYMGLYSGAAVATRPPQGNDRHVPMTAISIPALAREYSGIHIGVAFEQRARQLAEILSRGDAPLSSYLTYSLREMMRNVFDHSESQNLWIAGQYWPNQSRVEIALLDEGVGIRRSLGRNRKLRVNDDEEALRLALEPGVSGNAERRDANDEWANSGYGLYVVSRIREFGGDFTICSGEQALFIGRKTTTFLPTRMHGTAVRIRMSTDTLIDWDRTLHRIVEDGEAIASENSKLDFVTASKISRLLLTTSDEERKS